jgi:hypothetical protein
VSKSQKDHRSTCTCHITKVGSAWGQKGGWGGGFEIIPQTISRKINHAYDRKFCTFYVSAVDLRSTVIVEFQHLCWFEYLFEEAFYNCRYLQGER